MVYYLIKFKEHQKCSRLVKKFDAQLVQKLSKPNQSFATALNTRVLTNSALLHMSTIYTQ